MIEKLDGEMRAKMVVALAEHLAISYERASEAMNVMWEATKDFVGEGTAPMSHEPDLSNPGVALAHRVEGALHKEFSGEEMFPVVIVVQSSTGHIGIASLAVTISEADFLLMLGRGAIRRSLRQEGQPG